MWTIIKFDNKSVDTLKQEFFQKLGEESVFYTPKIFVQKYKNNKLVNKEYNLLGEYLFCYHREFSKSSTLSYLKYTKGLRYFLSGFRQCQDEIKNFILKCKQLENDKGLITHSLFELNIATQYKFKTGPFTVGPITAPPISATAAGKNVLSTSDVNTPGDTIFSAI